MTTPGGSTCLRHGTRARLMVGLLAAALAATACGSRLQTGELEAANGVLTRHTTTAGASAATGSAGATAAAPVGGSEVAAGSAAAGSAGGTPQAAVGGQAGTLSGGQQQMLALARALVKDPTVVLADELSVGLAPVVVDEILEALNVLQSEGVSLLIVEQYVERAVAMADYVYILNKGAVVFVGEPGQCASGAVFERYLGATA